MKLIAVALIAAVALAVPATAQQGSKQADPAVEETPDFLHLSGIMAQQQMRHIKLWFAGAAGNWPLADYEIDGLKEGFDDVAKLLGDDIAQQHVGDAMAELEKSEIGNTDLKTACRPSSGRPPTGSLTSKNWS